MNIDRNKLTPMMKQYFEVKIDTLTVYYSLDLETFMKCFLKML